MLPYEYIKVILFNTQMYGIGKEKVISCCGRILLNMLLIYENDIKMISN